MSRRVKFAALAVAISLPLAIPLAEARQLSAAGEVVVTVEGKLASPWVEKQACVKGTAACKSMIVNPVTNEIARMGDQLSSRFERTGKGYEIRRAASAVDKALQRKS